MLNYAPSRNRCDRARSRSRKRSVAGKKLPARPRSRRPDSKPTVPSLRPPRNVSVSCSASWRAWMRILQMTKALSTLPLRTAPQRRARFCLLLRFLLLLSPSLLLLRLLRRLKRLSAPTPSRRTLTSSPWARLPPRPRKPSRHPLPSLPIPSTVSPNKRSKNPSSPPSPAPFPWSARPVPGPRTTMTGLPPAPSSTRLMRKMITPAAAVPNSSPASCSAPWPLHVR